jgi:hypothetical protein
MVLDNVEIGRLVSMIRKNLLLTAMNPSCISNMTRSAGIPSLNTDQLRAFWLHIIRVTYGYYRNWRMFSLHNINRLGLVMEKQSTLGMSCVFAC